MVGKLNIPFGALSLLLLSAIASIYSEGRNGKAYSQATDLFRVTFFGSRVVRVVVAPRRVTPREVRAER